MRMRITLETLAPLSISRAKSTGNELRTASRIPGATWRGALAAHLIAERELGKSADENPDFQQLFLSDRVRFGDLRIEGRRPWPLSARGCTRNDKHPVVDLLTSTALRRSRPIECQHPDCGAKTGLPRGEYYVRDKYGFPMPAGPLRRITAHTAIAGRSLRVREAQFFSTEVLERQQNFEGALWCTEAAENAVRGAIGNGVRLTVGRGGTRGHGDALLTMAEPSAVDATAAIKRRLTKFNEPFRDSGEVAFTCTLVSPALDS